MWHAGLGRSVNYEVQEVSEDPELQVGQVIAIMNGYVVEDSGTPEVMEQAQQAVATNPGDPLSAIFQHVKRQMRFVQDEHLTGPVAPFYKDRFVEGLVRPVDVAVHPDLRFGDCDDHAMYTAALLRACQIPCSFVTVAADERDPSQFTHVYVAAYPQSGERVAMDTSHGKSAGWEHPGAYRIEEWPVEDGSRAWMVLALVAGAGWMLYRKWGRG
jgi:transglutaminase-like putative cysteine protease